MTATEMSTTDRATEVADGFRALADFIDAHPDWADRFGWQTINVYCTTPEEFTTKVSELGGRRDKTANGDFFGVDRTFGGVTVYLYTDRENVCEQVKVGERTVEREITEVVGVETVVEDVFEWVCTDSVLA